MPKVEITDFYTHEDNDNIARVELLEKTFGDGTKEHAVRVNIEEQYSRKQHVFVCNDWEQANAIFSAMRLTV
jgi:hypothetical protein